MVSDAPTPFQIRVCSIEEGTNSVLHLPAFKTTAVPALARVDRVTGNSELAWMPLQDGLHLGMDEIEQQRLRSRLYEIAAQKLGGQLLRGNAAADTIPVVDVALPCLDKKMSSNRSVHWNQVDGKAEFGGFAQTIAAGWLAVAREETDLPAMEWSHTARMSGATARAILIPLLESYGSRGQDLTSISLAADYDVEFCVDLDGSAAAGWYRLGAERTYEFFRTLCRVSGALQTAIRRWLPMLWLADGTMFRYPREAAAFLAYSSLPAVWARSRRNYTYDAVDIESMKQALAQCGRRMQRQLQIWHPSLEAMQQEAADELHPRRHASWAEELSKRSKRIQTLLANEAWLIDQFVNFAADFDQHSAREELYGTVRRARAMHAGLEARFRRWWDGRQAMEILGLMLLEATSALSPAPVNLTVVMRQTGTSGEPPVPIVLQASRGVPALEDAPRLIEAA